MSKNSLFFEYKIYRIMCKALILLIKMINCD